MVGPWSHHALKTLIIVSWFIFALREKEIFRNEQLQESLRGKRQPTVAVCPQSLHEGASSPEKPQIGKDGLVSGILLCSGTINHSMS